MKKLISTDFQKPKDPAHVWRTFNGKPKEFDQLIAEHIPVRGISYRPDAAKSFVLGYEREIELEPEPDNKHDPDALAVVGYWTDEDGKWADQIGWIPREVAEDIAENHLDKDLFVTIAAIFKPMDGKGLGLRINIWGMN